MAVTTRGTTPVPPDARPRLTVLSGPSGVGKSTVVAHMRKKHPEVWLSVSATTRKPRPGEQHRADRGVPARPLQSLEQQLLRFHGERVAHFRPVQRDRGDPVGSLVADALFIGH